MPDCPHCDRKIKDQNGLWMHIRAKHPGERYAHLKPAITREPSMAEELIDAQIAHACGEPVPDYLREMFPEEFDGGDHG